MRKFKRKWNSELDEIVPKLSQEVLSAPIMADTEKVVLEEKAYRFKMVKRFSLSAICVLITLILAIGLTSSHYFSSAPKVFANGYATVLEINPKVVFSVNGEGKVVSVSALNIQADVILSDEERVESLKGKTTSQAIKLFIDYSAMLGYIDIDGEDAIKISHSKCENFSTVIEEVEQFFKEKGYFTLIFEQEIELSEVCNMLEVENSHGLDGLNEQMSKMPILYSNRKARDKTQEEIQNIYKEEMILGDMRKFVKAQIDLWFESGDKLTEIYNLNKQISDHELNPLANWFGAETDYSTSYWSVVSYPWMDWVLEKDKYSEFNAFIEKMTNLLEEYEREYGIKLDLRMLNTIYKLNCSEEGKLLQQILETNDDELYMQYLPIIKEILPEITHGMPFDENFDDFPKDEREYNLKMEGFFKNLFGAYLERNDRNYHEERQSISDIDYSQFLQDKIDKFGSVENYWNSLQER